MSMIQLTDVTFHYPGSYDNVFERASVRFDTRWKLGLTGRTPSQIRSANKLLTKTLTDLLEETYV